MSKPQRLGKVLPDVLETIKDRCNRYRKKHGLPTLNEELEKNSYRKRVLSAVVTFIASKK